MRARALTPFLSILLVLTVFASASVAQPSVHRQPEVTTLPGYEGLIVTNDSLVLQATGGPPDVAATLQHCSDETSPPQATRRCRRRVLSTVALVFFLVLLMAFMAKVITFCLLDRLLGEYELVRRQDPSSDAGAGSGDDAPVEKKQEEPEGETPSESDSEPDSE